MTGNTNYKQEPLNVLVSKWPGANLNRSTSMSVTASPADLNAGVTTLSRAITFANEVGGRITPCLQPTMMGSVASLVFFLLGSGPLRSHVHTSMDEYYTPKPFRIASFVG